MRKWMPTFGNVLQRRERESKSKQRPLKGIIVQEKHHQILCLSVQHQLFKIYFRNVLCEAFNLLFCQVILLDEVPLNFPVCYCRDVSYFLLLANPGRQWEEGEVNKKGNTAFAEVLRWHGYLISHKQILRAGRIPQIAAATAPAHLASQGRYGVRYWTSFTNSKAPICLSMV